MSLCPVSAMHVGARLHAPQSSGTKLSHGVNSRHFGSERERARARAKPNANKSGGEKKKEILFVQFLVSRLWPLDHDVSVRFDLSTRCRLAW